MCADASAAERKVKVREQCTERERGKQLEQKRQQQRRGRAYLVTAAVSEVCCDDEFFELPISVLDGDDAY